MKIKTFGYLINDNTKDFDSRVNDFIKGKQVVQITTNTINIGDLDLMILTVLYKEE